MHFLQQNRAFYAHLSTTQDERKGHACVKNCILIGPLRFCLQHFFLMFYETLACRVDMCPFKMKKK